MAQVEVIMPKMGESITEATITKWLKKEGDVVEADEPIVEIATDKVDSEVPAPVSGKIVKILYKENDVVPVGSPIAIIETEGEATTEGTARVPEEPVQEVVQPVANQSTEPAVAQQTKVSQESVKTTGDNGDRSKFFSPVVMRIAQEHGVSMTELASIKGTGLGGRVTKKDILRYIKEKESGAVATQPVTEPQPAQQPTPQPIVQQQPTPQPVTQQAPAVVSSEDYENKYGGPVEVIEMDRVRRLIAEHMVKSKQTSPHVTSFAEADVTKIVKWREKIKDEFFKREGFKLTYTPIFIEAAVKALKDYPLLNSSVEGNKIIVKKFINIGVAVALPDGNLIVPVIKNADQYNLVGLARILNDLVTRARKGQLRPEDIEGGTFTLTNVGTFGSIAGTPIINQPQVAILATGTIKKRPVVIETEEGDMIGIRHMMISSLSYDHRIIDGALGATFLNRFVYYVENFDINRKI
ncbi:MAG: 2-oxo acid dehydrogenase subunit E2 [Chlorobi bacterium]|nr:2-oxo acid dehydrogenase subunit E2 [Chlorobiota bacterium]